MTSKPLVAFVGTGGTIMRKGRHPLDFHDYGESGKSLSLDELIASVPQISEIADIFAYNFSLERSTSFTSQHLLQLNQTIHEVASSRSPDAFVIIQGTATLEEVGFFIHLVAKCKQPIVLVGAQRPSNVLSSDGPLNLYHAVQVAVSRCVMPLRVVMVMNSEIHSPRDVTKSNNYALNAFKSNYGPVGTIGSDGKVCITRNLSSKLEMPVFDLEKVTQLPRVDITYSYLGAGGAAISAFISEGAEGIVSAGMAPGLVSPPELDALLEARRRGIVVVQSSRAGGGTVVATRRTEEYGFVAAGDLNPQKARILTMLALTITRDHQEIGRIFEYC